MTANTTDSAQRNWLPILLKIVATILILISTAFPYWRMVLEAPQYPLGLEMRVFVNRMTDESDEDTDLLDDVKEIDGLNHYIGMKSLYNAAKVERAIAIPAIALMIILLLISAFWKWRFAWVFALPPIFFPFIFLADLGLWMRYYGRTLDPSAPLSSAIGPFTPPVIGEGVIGNFRTVAYIQPGWYLAVAGGALVAVALIIQYLSGRGAENGQETAA